MYLSLLLGVLSSITIIYKLAIDDIPFLVTLFPHFTEFVAVSVITGIPACVLIGYAHSKRTQALAADLSISVESNPYNYKAVPGKEKDVQIPLALFNLRVMRDVLKDEGGWTDEYEREYLFYAGLLLKLQEGRSV